MTIGGRVIGQRGLSLPGKQSGFDGVTVCGGVTGVNVVVSATAAGVVV